MKIFKNAIDDCKALRDGIPGSRFRDYADRCRKRRGRSMTWGRALSFMVAFVLIAVGLGIGWLPGPGGFLAIIGLALLAKEIPVVADILDRVEVFGRKKISSWKKFFGAGAARRGRGSDSKNGSLKVHSL